MLLVAQVVIFDDNVVIRTPYNPGWIADLKLEIPSYSRSWDKPNRVWEVDPLYKNLAIQICQRYFSVEVDDQTKTQKQLQAPDPGDWADVLLDAIPENLHKSVYRRLCMALHPDQAGDEGSDLIKVLTVAYAKRHK